VRLHLSTSSGFCIWITDRISHSCGKRKKRMQRMLSGTKSTWSDGFSFKNIFQSGDILQVWQNEADEEAASTNNVDSNGNGTEKRIRERCQLWWENVCSVLKMNGSVTFGCEDKHFSIFVMYLALDCISKAHSWKRVAVALTYLLTGDCFHTPAHLFGVSQAHLTMCYNHYN